MNEIPVPAGTTVFITIRASNLSKDLWGSNPNGGYLHRLLL